MGVAHASFSCAAGTALQNNPQYLLPPGGCCVRCCSQTLLDLSCLKTRLPRGNRSPDKATAGLCSVAMPAEAASAWTGVHIAELPKRGALCAKASDPHSSLVSLLAWARRWRSSAPPWRNRALVHLHPADRRCALHRQAAGCGRGSGPPCRAALQQSVPRCTTTCCSLQLLCRYLSLLQCSLEQDPAGSTFQTWQQLIGINSAELWGQLCCPHTKAAAAQPNGSQRAPNHS